MTEKEYHALPIDRYSSIKAFIEDRKKYYSKYILKENHREEKTVYTVFGSLVDCLMFSPEELESRFVLVTCKKPTGQMGDFVDKLWKRTLDCLSEDGVVTRSIDALMTDAYADVAFDKYGDKIAFKRKTLEQVMEEFVGGDAGDWYRQQRESVDKSLIEQEDLDKANRVVEELRNNFVTSDIMNRLTDDRYTVLYQVIVVFEYRGLKIKSMLDMVVVDHQKKRIEPKDLKTTHNVEEFDNNYRGYKYYIQAATYNEALKVWAEENDLKDYEIVPMEFIVTDSSNYMNPLIYRLRKENLDEAYNGYFYNETYYPGLDEAIDRLLWHKENNVWNISKGNHENNGVRDIKRLGKSEGAELIQIDGNQTDDY